MELQEIILPFGVSIGIGALIGLERERNKQERGTISPLGIRTSILFSLFGAISGFLFRLFDNPWVLIFAMITVLLLVVSSHVLLIAKHNRFGLTTEITEVLIFTYGAMCTAGLIQLAVMLAIVTTLVLSIKEHLHSLAKNISDREMFDTLKFAIIAFIVLPFLPDRSFDVMFLDPLLPATDLHGSFAGVNVLNPYRIWFLVVFVSGVSYIGYILVKLFGKKVGLSLSGLMGGLYSSTATSLTLAHKSKELKSVRGPFIAGIVLACAVSYIKSFIFIRALNEELFLRTLMPLGLMFLYLLGIGLYMLLRTKKKEMGETKGFKTPFTLRSALKLGAFIVAALLVAKISLSLAGVELYYVIATLSAFFAVDDPIVISTSAIAGDLLSMFDAKNIILLVTYLNMVQKVFIVYLFGNRKLVKPLAFIFAGLFLVTLVGFIYL